MSEIVNVAPEEYKRATILLNRVNNVIKRLNSIADEIVEFEKQYSSYIVEQQKLMNTMSLINDTLKDIESLIQSEQSTLSSLRTLPSYHFIKKRRLTEQLEDISATLIKKEARLSELKKEQKNLSTKVNCAKHLMTRHENANELYFYLIDHEYNPLIENLVSITDLDYSTITDDTIKTIQPLNITLNIQNQEEDNDEDIY